MLSSLSYPKLLFWLPKITKLTFIVHCRPQATFKHSSSTRYCWGCLWCRYSHICLAASIHQKSLPTIRQVLTFFYLSYIQYIIPERRFSNDVGGGVRDTISRNLPNVDDQITNAMLILYSWKVENRSPGHFPYKRLRNCSDRWNKTDIRNYSRSTWRNSCFCFDGCQFSKRSGEWKFLWNNNRVQWSRR